MSSLIETGIERLHAVMGRIGLHENLSGADKELLQRISDWGRVGVVTHASSGTRDGVPVIESLHRGLQAVSAAHQNSGPRVVAAFGPQHGYWQCEPYNMFETPDGQLTLRDGKVIPLYSLYGALREPSARQLENIDTLVVDLPDIGCRIYTYMTTLAGCLKSAARAGKRVVVLDRPNPLGLNAIEGNVIEPGLSSFVGWFYIPMRHGMTLGELGRFYIIQEQLRVDYDVVVVAGLKRATPVRDFMEDLPRMASPNMPGQRTMGFFPVSVALEGTNISEGRGTTTPFQNIGSPFLDENRLCDALDESFERLGLESPLVWRPTRFAPSFDKFKGQVCKGVFLDAPVETGFPVFEAAIALLAALARSSGTALEWRAPGYEYNFESNPLDLILGHTRWRAPLEVLRTSNADRAWQELKNELAEAAVQAREFAKASAACLLYS